VREGVFANVPGESPTLEQALAPVVEWARETDPAALDGIVHGGLPVYRRESATRWLALVERYRAARGG
jgi:hypothetical protein